MDIVAAALGTICLLAGVVIGLVACYIWGMKPLWDDYREAVDRMYRMKKQGFVPQFEIQQPAELDPSEGIVEY